MNDIVKDFLVETHENLEQLDRDFVIWEQNPDDKERLARIFRVVHTIKGTCGFLGLPKLEKLAHSGENLLAKLRDGKISLNGRITTALLSMLDGIRRILAELESTGTESDGDYSGIQSQLALMAEGNTPVSTPAPSKDWNHIEAGVLPAKETLPKLGEILIAGGYVAPTHVDVAIRAQYDGDARPLGEILVDKGLAHPADIKAALLKQKKSHISLADSTVRVEIALLESLMNQMEELVLSRNHISQLTAGTGGIELIQASQKLGRISRELQSGLMKTRMQPLRQLWSKLPRMVRDLSMACGKTVRIELQGQDTELDKGVMDALRDPLTHIVRNAMDHGFESPEERSALGKDPQGILALKAYQTNGQVVMEISDNGKGLDSDRIKAKALEKGLIPADRVDSLTEAEIFGLIFLPGFSTVETVTNVSGRGVGMDVVRSQITAISGTVELKSWKGKGTTLIIRIPLTLSILPALIVDCQGVTCAIPQTSLVELIRFEGEKRKAAIERVHGFPVCRLRGHLLPLFHLAEVLEINSGAPGQWAQAEGETLQILVVEADHRRFGLAVSRVFDIQEIVVKPLHKALKNLQVYTGSAILGSGKTALILDVSGLAARLHLPGVENEIENMPTGPAKSDTRKSFLVCRVANGSHFAIPLDKIMRLEKFRTENLETSGLWKSVQYRSGILPILPLDGALTGQLNRPEMKNAGEIQVVVYESGQKLLGLAVESILDIVQGDLERLQDPGRDGVHGNLVIGGRVAEWVDVEAFALAHDPGFFRRHAVSEAAA